MAVYLKCKNLCLTDQPYIEYKEQQLQQSEELCRTKEKRRELGTLSSIIYCKLIMCTHVI